MKEIINKLLSEKNLPKTEFYKKIGMTGKGYLQMLENNSMKVATLKKIAEVLDVPIGYFFGEMKEKENAEILSLLRENRELRLRIEALERAKTAGSNPVLPKLEGTKKAK